MREKARTMIQATAAVAHAASILAVLLLLAVQGTAPALGSEAAAPAPDRVRGIDVSHHNGDIDWRQVAAGGIAFAIVKATDGLDYLDPAFVRNFAAVGDAGLVRGAYHFYETDDDGAGQAAWFIHNVVLGPGDLPPVVDIEGIKAPVDGDLHKQFNIFLDALTAQYGRRPIIYTGRNFWEHAMKEHLPGYPLWIAEYGVDAPAIPVEWADWRLWQYTEALSATGVTVPVDGSYFNGDLSGLEALLIPAGQASPTP